LCEVAGIGVKTAKQIASSKPQEIADNQKRQADKHNAQIVTLLSDNYPHNLKLLFKSPPLLNVAGEILEEDRLAVGVVGSRKPTPYGRIATERLTSSLASKGFTIVSGFARGIDTISHNTALQSGGRTIAVLGGGIDRLYPPENRDIFKEVIKNGAVVSQFPFGAEPHRMNFPIRNRVIGGLSIALAVIEAGEKSGALITAYASLEEGRDVFAVPGRIDSPMSVGTNRLIQKGAKLMASADDLIEELPEAVRLLLNREPAKKDFTDKTSPAKKDENALLELLDGEEKHIDYLIEKSALSSGIVLGLLLELELKGRVRQLPGKLFARV